MRLKLTQTTVMNWTLIIMLAANAIILAADQIDLQRNQGTSDSLVKDATSTQGIACIDDVTCTTTDDVTAARRSWCPAKCSCLPLDGQEAWTKLTVDCSAGTQSNFTRDLVRLLSSCTSELLELTITHSPLTAIPEVVCCLSKIQKLRLDSNQLASLPGNCFTHMHNLTSFSANYNRLTSLQVRCRSMFSSQ